MRDGGGKKSWLFQGIKLRGGNKEGDSAQPAQQRYIEYK
jgi:hypothetical protein